MKWTTVDGRNPKQPPDMYETLVNNWINYLSLNWWMPDFWTINSISSISTEYPIIPTIQYNEVYMCLIDKGPLFQEYLYFPYDMGLIFPYSSILHPCSSTSPFAPSEILVQKTPQGNPYASKCKHCKCALHQPGVSLAIWKMGVTPTETNIGPENSWLAEYFSFGGLTYFQRLC